MKKNPVPSPFSQPKDKPVLESPEIGLTEVEIRAKNFRRQLEVIKKKAIARVKGEAFLLVDEGKEYSIVQDGRIRIRVLKTGKVEMEKFEDTSNSKVISAVEKLANKG